MSDFDRVILEEIGRRGPVSFAEFMSWALYHPHHGYYAGKARPLGKRGDFFTSVQVGDLFPRLMAEAVAEMWDILGGQRFSLVELGGGDGTLAEGILSALQEKGRADKISYHFVEKGNGARNAARRRLSRFKGVRYFAGIEELEHTSGLEGCVFSNEFFDALPVHRVVREGGELRELLVAVEEGRLAEKTGPALSKALRRAVEGSGMVLSEGQKAEVCPAAAEVLAEISRILSRGFVLTVDYGGAAAETSGEAKPEGTLRAFHAHGLAPDPLSAAGEQDLTASVNFTALVRWGEAAGLLPLIYADQGPYLLATAEDVLRRAVEGEKDPLKRLAGARQVQQLLHPRAMGAVFRVLVQWKNVGAAAPRAMKVNRLQRLESVPAGG